MSKTALMWGLLTIGLSLLLLAQASGQAVPPSPAVPNDLRALIERFVERTRALSDDVKAAVGDKPAGRALTPDSQELVQAAADFQAALPKSRDLFTLRQRYAGIDATWHHLQAELGRSEVSSPAVERDAARVSEVDAQIHKALGLNVYPTGYYGNTEAPAGPLEWQRLSHALVDRADGLASAIRADLAGDVRAVQAAISLASLADNFHDAIELTSLNLVLRNEFAVVSAQSKTLARELGTITITPRVRDAWQAYRAAEVLLRQSLGIPNDPDDLVGSAIPATGPSPFADLSKQLAVQVETFVQGFRPVAATVADGPALLADAERLSVAARRFRDVAARGLSAGQLAFEFRDVDVYWQRLVRRTNRIPRGATRPSLEELGAIGQTAARLHQLLALPGYAPVVEPLLTTG